VLIEQPGAGRSDEEEAKQALPPPVGTARAGGSLSSVSPGAVSGLRAVRFGAIPSPASFPARREPPSCPCDAAKSPAPRFAAAAERGSGSRAPTIRSYYLCVFYLFTINCYRAAITAASG